MEREFEFMAQVPIKPVERRPLNLEQYRGVFEKRGGFAPASTVAEIMGVSRQRVYQLISSGLLGFVEIGPHRMVILSEVEQRLKNRKGGV